jgi:diguanylate cyclase (GGDEF)-like protein
MKPRHESNFKMWNKWINTIVTKFSGRELSDIADEDRDLEYFKNHLFYTMSFFFIILGPVLFFYGAYLFFEEGKYFAGIIEFSLYFFILFVFLNPRIDVHLKKFYFILMGYAASNLVLVVAGSQGAGLLCITSVLIFSGSFLSKTQISKFLVINFSTYLVITLLLFNGYLSDFGIVSYQKTWLIVSLSSQFFGVGLLVLIQTIYNGLENQAKIITESKAVIMENEQRYRFLSYHDQLTGLKNRLYWDDEYKRLDEAEALPVSVIVSDINGIKLVNDSFGYEAGDQIIVETGKIMKNCCNRDDVIARTGGDEFSILMIKTDKINALKRLEAIKTAIKNYNCRITNEAFQINLTMGTGTKNSSTENLEDVIKMAVHHMNQRKLLERKSSHSVIISSIKATMFERSHETEQHCERLAELSKKVGKALHLTQVELDNLVLLATLHDIGKIGIRDQILGKPGKLDEEEWREMKKHPEIGYRIAIASPELVSVADYIYSHHEHWDGSGYPEGLVGDMIPLLSRIINITDAYDAMTENRVYHQAMDPQMALAEIKKQSGTQFDPQIAEVFIRLMEED